jgi:hypothetical protein
MATRFETAKIEFENYLESVELSHIAPNSDQYLSIQTAFYCGMLASIGKLTVEGKEIEKDELENAMNILTEEIVNTLEL